jgi:hypothetical protein
MFIQENRDTIKNPGDRFFCITRSFTFARIGSMINFVLKIR